MRARMGRGFSSQRKNYLLLAVFVLALFVLNVPCPAGQDSALDLAGKRSNPFQLAPGKVVVLVFVRTDCPVANRYAPMIQRIGAQYAQKAAFWLVYPSKAESVQSIRKHQQVYGYKIPALRDPAHILVKESQAQITPEVAVFDASGKLIYHGRIDDQYVEIGRTRSAPTTHELEDAIQAAIEGKRLSAATKPAVGCYISDVE